MPLEGTIVHFFLLIMNPLIKKVNVQLDDNKDFST